MQPSLPDITEAITCNSLLMSGWAITRFQKAWPGLRS
jgi:hypothetical protein